MHVDTGTAYGKKTNKTKTNKNVHGCTDIALRVQLITAIHSTVRTYQYVFCGIAVEDVRHVLYGTLSLAQSVVLDL